MAKNQPRPWMRWAFPLVLAATAFGAAGCAPGGDDTVADVVDARDDAGGGDEATDAPDGETAGPPPTLTAVSPPSGPIAGGTLSTLTGENIATGAVATLDGTACTEPFVASARRMTCRTPAHAAGAVDVVLENPDGQSAMLAGAFTYDASGPRVGWCLLDRPAATTAQIGTPTATIHGRVLVAGVTDGAGEGLGVTGEVGVGTPGSAPDSGAWTWTAMTYEASVDGPAPGDLAVDEYGTAVDAPASSGSYVYAVRFSVDGGTTWTVCDTSGAGFSEINAGRLTATDPATGPLVEWCNLQWPSSLRATAGTPTDRIYGRVWVEGVTTLVGQGTGIRGQVGYGAASADPATWTWTEAGYNVDVDGLVAGDHANDEYWQPLTVPAAGTYAYAYRFTMDGGLSWRTCDLDGTTVGEFSIDQAGSLVVE